MGRLERDRGSNKEEADREFQEMPLPREDVDATAPWIHARTGQGRLLIRGAIQDVDASTIQAVLEGEEGR